MISYEKSKTILKKAKIKIKDETIKSINSLNRVVSTNIYSNIDYPAGNNAAFDGYAINSKDTNGLKKKFPNKIITNNDNLIFKDKDINLVSIASYDNYHYKQIIKSLKNNKNIIIEKPMCLTFQELRNIKKLLIKKKLKITSNLVLRTNSLFKEIKKKINQKKIFYIEADYIWGRKYKFSWHEQSPSNGDILN